MSALADELPEEVVTFGGNAGRTYHSIDPVADELRPFCGQHGRNPLRKDRAAIESHYEPCARCFAGLEEGST